MSTRKSMMRSGVVVLPHLGRVLVHEVKREPGHFVWLDGFGWHDCLPIEDVLARSATGGDRCERTTS